MRQTPDSHETLALPGTPVTQGTLTTQDTRVPDTPSTQPRET